MNRRPGAMLVDPEALPCLCRSCCAADPRRRRLRQQHERGQRAIVIHGKDRRPRPRTVRR